MSKIKLSKIKEILIPIRKNSCNHQIIMSPRKGDMSDFIKDKFDTSKFIRIKNWEDVEFE